MGTLKNGCPSLIASVIFLSAETSGGGPGITAVRFACTVTPLRLTAVATLNARPSGASDGGSTPSRYSAEPATAARSNALSPWPITF